jgi:hypothetical protein
LCWRWLQPRTRNSGSHPKQSPTPARDGSTVIEDGTLIVRNGHIIAIRTRGVLNYTPANVVDHLRREAFDGTAVTQSVGSGPVEASIIFQRDQRAGKFPPGVAVLLHAGIHASQQRS